MVVRRREVVLVLFLSCFLAHALAAKTPAEPRVGCPAGFQASWSYGSPFSWGNLCPYYATCGAGMGQSPINVPALNNTGRLIAPLRFNFSKETLKLIRVGNYLNFPVTQSVSTLRWRDTPNRELVYRLTRIEFHSPSEHTLQGQRAALEVQLYFTYNDSRGVREVAVAQLYNVGTCPDSFLNNIIPALPRRGSCTCGNNRTESFAPFFEECDSGNLNSNTRPNACRTNCRLPRCGDGVVDAGEQCDNGAANSANGTCRGCKLPTCGDGIVDTQLGEQCDDRNNFSGDGCAGNCTLECGNGCLEGNEACDDGPANSNLPTSDTRTCRTTCQFQKCGDGITDTQLGEQCDGGIFCRTNCTLKRCGDGNIDREIGETCDPPNASTYCSTNCTRVPRCGDGIVDAGEQCDDNSTYCQANCTNLCGDGIIQSAFGETCDNGRSPVDGNSNTRPNACRLTCRKARCGDGIIDPVNCEQCDNGPQNANASNACRLNCKNPICGDGIKDNGEQCDDGNRVDNDGCTCCRLDCGNGIVDLGEQCDDGAANDDVNPDRCRTNCLIHFCGDGVVDYDEECDWASSASPNCTRNCTLPFCGDGITQYNLGEQCDNGDANSYTALDGCSPICTLNRCGQVTSGQVVDFNSIFGSYLNGTYYYKGSQTHPPCTQNVEWFVSTNIKTLSLDQYATFDSTFDANARPAQGWYGRNVGLFPTTTYGFVPIDPRAINNCGDSVVESNEECDDGASNANVPDACRTNCKAPRCGDGIVDSGEECDGEQFCSSVCTIVVLGYLNPRSYADGAVGNLQSPIRLPEACPSGRPFNLNNPANIRYNPTPVVLFNTGEQILFPVQNGGTFNWQGRTYTLTWIEFSEPSEHYIGNKRFAFEIQLFHQATTPGDRNVALSVLFDEVESRNAFLDPILNRLPEFSRCQCGNGKKEDVMWARSGNIYKEECDCGKDNNDHTPGTCRTNCRLPYCGDGVQDPCEACDQGKWNANKPNSCRPNCVLPFCGDGITDSFYGETCDDGNNRPGDGCDANCQKECGNGVLDANEQCDDGPYNSDSKANECRTNCKFFTCGDGVIDFNEECDFGTANSNTAPNGCRSSCTLPVCGDRVVDTAYGETCDDGNKVNGDGCDANCQSECGNGVKEGAEECDDGSCNSNSVPNACRLNCRLPRCGDGVRDANEQCDTGANTPQCQNCIVRCGNGVLESGEECDNGIYNTDSLANGCRTNCRLAYCGDGILDALEECDAGAANSNTSDKCRTWCRIPKCGDGIVDAGNKEACDDGNTLDGDGCDSCCKRECGNGRVDPGEQCDAGAGNSDTRPGCCRSTCTFPVCGDGVTDFGEECDNGRNNTFGPNTCRPDCTLPKCGDGIVDHLYGEICDQGGRNSWTTIDGCATDCTPNVCRQSVAFNTTVNPADWIPKQAGVYYYQGSYTDAPYTENFDWFVFATPQTISSCQLAQFRKVLTDNARCLQARNNRPVTYLQITSVCGDGLIEGNEECDNGPANSDFAPDSCRRNCRLPRCGDGVQDKGEQCDGTPNCTPTCGLSCPAAAEYPQMTNQTTTTTSSVVDENVINVNFSQLFSS